MDRKEAIEKLSSVREWIGKEYYLLPAEFCYGVKLDDVIGFLAVEQHGEEAAKAAAEHCALVKCIHDCDSCPASDY